MVHSRALPFGLASTLLLGACSDTQARERLRENARATWESAKEVAFETREQAEQALRQKQAELDAGLRELGARAEQATAEARAGLERELGQLELERQELLRRLDELERGGREAWERLVTEARHELSLLEQRLARALEDGG